MEVASRQYRFCRPQNQKQVTRFLFVGCSGSCDPDAISSSFTEYAVETIVHCSKYFCFVVFQSEAAAEACMHAWRSNPSWSANENGKALVTSLKYADVRVLPQVGCMA